MAHCCSQCSFVAQFESALLMHHQLHHESTSLNGCQELGGSSRPTETGNTLPRTSNLDTFAGKENKGLRLTSASSATRLFEKLRSRLRTRSRTLFSHPEDLNSGTLMNELSCASEGTSKEFNRDMVLKSSVMAASVGDTPKEKFGCHLCNFDADRITALDRHLLNEHKIGLDNLLKLVMAKTKDGLSDDSPNAAIYGIRQTYYKPPNEVLEEGEFVIQTVTPRIKILKHAWTNTDVQWTEVFDLKDNCRTIAKELDHLMVCPADEVDKRELLSKMQVLSECMCKFADSTKTLKKALVWEYGSKPSVRERLSAEPLFELGLGDQDSPRDWERAHSERLERARHKYNDNSRDGKSKLSSESFYF